MKPSPPIKYIILLAALALLASPVMAAVPQTVNYQGYLKNADGTPVNTAANLTFNLYSSTSGAGAVWNSGTVSITPSNGIYSVQLGQPPQPPLPSFDRPYWLGVTAGADPEMRPLQPLASAPYAFHAETAAAVLIGAVTDSSISGVISAGKLDLSSMVAKGGDTMSGALNVPVDGLAVGTDQLVASGGNIGIGTASPSEKLDIAGTVKATGIIGDGAGITNIRYAKVAIVGQSGVNYTSPVAAMTDVAAWCGTPSDTNLCMMKILPGVYDLGSTSLVMQAYVDIEGSGEYATILTGAVGNAAIPTTNGVVNGASNAEIRSVTVRNIGTGEFVPAILNSGASPRITNVTAIASGGVRNFGVRNVSLSSPAMTNVTATASGGNYSYGVYNYTSSSPTMNNVTATAVGANTNAAVSNSYSSPTMDNVIASASGGNVSYGVYNNNSSPTMRNVTANAKGGMSNYGMYIIASTAQTISVDGSSFEGSTGSIYNSSALCMLTVGASKLVGPRPTLGAILASYTDTTTLSSATTGPQTFQSGDDFYYGVVVKANSATQSANLQEWQASTGEVKASISAVGVITGDGSGLSNIRYAKVAIVGQSGANYTSPVAAMTGIAAWCGTPSDTNPCLVKILPGVYDLGSTSLMMQPYVDIEGSGENATILTAAVSNAAIPTTNGVVNGASNAEIRSVTVRNIGTGQYVPAILNSGASPRMTNVTAIASGGVYNYGVRNVSSSSPMMTNVTATASGGSYSYGVYNYTSSSPIMNNVTATADGANLNAAVLNNTSSPTMDNVIATASGGSFSYGVHSNSSSPTMKNVTVTASAGTTTSYGINNINSGTVKIDRSTVSGTTSSIFNGAGVTTFVGSTRLDGEAVVNSGVLTCVGAYNGNYTSLNASCQ